MPIYNPPPAAAAGAAVASGSYTGDSTVNRAIAHGLGATPKLVIITYCYGTYYFMIWARVANIKYQVGASGGQKAVTIMDAINFYVGNATNYIYSANLGTYVYDWLAIG